ncbi:SAM hydrolase/SAM-dependent halogenase family protein [[Eubacterium] cellulosolvens]
MDIITLTTDFGFADEYVAAMKGVILKINPKIRLIDISHSVLPQNIHQGAYFLYSVVSYYPNAIHIGVVDPGVGTERSALIFKCKSGVLLGPDNGLLFPAAERLGIQSVVRITNKKYCLNQITSTFHGRDVFAPVAAYISKGVPIEEMGDEVTDYIWLNLFDVEERSGKIIGRVLNIDQFGNIIINISKDVLKNYFIDATDLIVTTKSTNHQITVPYKSTYGEAPPGLLLATISSSGFLELAGNQCSANEEFQLYISDTVTIQKAKK